MKPSVQSCSLILALLLGTLSLAGCGGALSVPDSVASINAAGPPISGSVFGGHAPIVGSHVYLLQPGTSGIGSLANSILGNNGATSANGYVLTADINDPNVTAGSEYVTTDSYGGFSLTGAYTCAVGQPVFIYAYGGTPTTSVTPAATYSISKIVVTNATGSGGSAGTATYTITVTSTELLYTGETIKLSGLTGNFSILNNSQVVLPDNNLTTTTFDITATDKYTGGNITNGTYTTTNFGTAGLVTAGPQINKSIVELATLGNCPSSGNFYSGNTALSFVFLNEVSTVAAAYTFQPFTLPANNTAWDIGSSGTTQGMLGIANAASTAAQLYNIQGGPTSTAYDGEGHLANNLTVGGNGIVPQATIDTLANILAACVDSAPNAGDKGLNGLSSQCYTLFSNATADASQFGTQPTDTATAAINIARYPGGNYNAGSNGVNTKFVANLYGIPTGDVPFTPNLTNQPNDFTIVINYPFAAVSGYTATNNTLEQAESIAIDSLGQVFITGRGNGSTLPPTVVRWSPLGVPNAGPFSNGTTLFGYVSVDGSNNAWASQTTGNGGIEEFIYNPTTDALTTAVYGSGYTNPRPLVTTNSGDAYFIASNSTTAGSSKLFEYGPLGTSIVGSPFTLTAGTLTTGDAANHGAIDANGDFWITSEISNQIALVNPSGTQLFPSITTTKQPEFPAIDGTGTAWIPIQATTSEIYGVANNGGNFTLTSGTNVTGPNLTATFGAAVDGNGNLWFTNRCGASGACVNGPGNNSIVEISGVTQTAISPPTTNLFPETQYPASSATLTRILSDPVNLAIDPSGNIWITNYTGSEVTEVIGIAAPIVTPLSAAAGTNKLGTTP